MEIRGPGAESVTLWGNADAHESVFSIVPPAHVRISGLTIAHGSAPSGGGIFNAGELTISDCVISGNVATTGGGIWNRGGALTIVRSTIRDNSAMVATGTSEVAGGGLYTWGSNAPDTDQRGVPRRRGAHVDVGAYESPNQAPEHTIPDDTLYTGEDTPLVSGAGVKRSRRTATAQARFDVSPATARAIDPRTIRLMRAGRRVKGAVRYDHARHRVVLDPRGRLAPGTYVVTIGTGKWRIKVPR